MPAVRQPELPSDLSNSKKRQNPVFLRDSVLFLVHLLLYDGDIEAGGERIMVVSMLFTMAGAAVVAKGFMYVIDALNR